LQVDGVHRTPFFIGFPGGPEGAGHEWRESRHAENRESGCRESPLEDNEMDDSMQER
jgi:hypothetical protein